MSRYRPTILFIVFFVVFTVKASAQGPLVPPGPPAPTMKTLDQVEPRMPISSIPATINEPGSYYVTTNLTGQAGQDGLTILADHVTIDLNGFALVGVTGSINGVSAPTGASDLTLRNGTIRGWGNSAMDVSFSQNILLEKLQAEGNSFNGLVTGPHSVLVACRALGNGGVGLLAGASSRIERCTSSGNATDGIRVSSQSRVTDNLCVGNGASAGAAILAGGDENTISDNTCRGGDRGLSVLGTNNIVSGNVVQGATDNYDLVDGNQLNLLLCEIPESIDWPAAVKLAGSLAGKAGANGITVNAAPVTLDLAGHTLGGVPGSLDGIHVTAGWGQTTIRNGYVTGWGDDGIDASGASELRITGVQAYGNTANGIQAGKNAVVRDCTADGNTVGIAASSSTIRNCVANQNGGDGISVSSTLVESCMAMGNNQGLQARDGSIIKGCSALLNDFFGIVANSGTLVMDCTGWSNKVAGVFADDGSMVKNCVVKGSADSGVQVDSNCQVTENLLAGNTIAPSNQSIRIEGTRNLVSRNHIVDSEGGIGPHSGDFPQTNIVVGNTFIDAESQWLFLPAWNAVGVDQRMYGSFLINTNDSHVNLHYF